jgi:hypothetical protein
MIDNLADVFRKESELRREQAEREQFALKVHRVVLEHKKTGERRTVYLIGHNFDKDLNDYKLAVNLQLRDKANQWVFVEQTGAFHLLHWASAETKKRIVYDWLPELPTAHLVQIKDYLDKKLDGNN